MKNLILMATLALTCTACDRQHTPQASANQSTPNVIANDNTEKNMRDRDKMTKTPFDQSENEIDRTITQHIRKALMGDDVLSTNAKNIKIITINGVVTLRGPVNSEKEKEIIAQKVQQVQGITKVDNQLEIIQK